MARTVKKAKPETARLQRLIADVEANLGHHTAELIDRLKKDEGLKLRFAQNTYACAMAGVAASCTAGEPMALRTWANAARRAILRGEAV